MLNGGIPLRGEVSISGAKNAVVAILPATILAQDVCVIENIPNISDVYYMTKILEQLGARIKRLSKARSRSTQRESTPTSCRTI